MHYLSKDCSNTNDKAITTYYSQDINITDTYIHAFSGNAIYLDDTFDGFNMIAQQNQNNSI